MPTLIMTGKLEKSWNHWVATDDGYKSARQAVGTKDIYRGHSADAPTSIHAVSWTPRRRFERTLWLRMARLLKRPSLLPIPHKSPSALTRNCGNM